MGCEWFARLPAALDSPCLTCRRVGRLAQDYCLIMPSYESQATLPQYFLLKARALPDNCAFVCLCHCPLA